MIVCFDTNAFIWGIRGIFNPSDAPRAQQAKRLVKRLRKAGIEIMIPACVMSESLSILDDIEARDLLAKYGTKLQIGEMDMAVIHHLGRLLNHHYRVNPEGWKGIGYTKRHLKYDVLIAATAIGHGAAAIYSHDNGMKVSAGPFIPVLGLDDMPAGFDQSEPEASSPVPDDEGLPL